MSFFHLAKNWVSFFLFFFLFFFFFSRQPKKASFVPVWFKAFKLFTTPAFEGVAKDPEKKGTTKAQVYHESRVGLLVTA